MRKKAVFVFITMMGVAGALSYLLLGWTGFITTTLIIFILGIFDFFAAKTRKKQDQDTARKYGAYGEVEPSNYRHADTLDPNAQTDEPNT